MRQWECYFYLLLLAGKSLCSPAAAGRAPGRKIPASTYMNNEYDKNNFYHYYYNHKKYHTIILFDIVSTMIIIVVTIIKLVIVPIFELITSIWISCHPVIIFKIKNYSCFTNFFFLLLLITSAVKIIIDATAMISIYFSTTCIN